jgi:phage terminase large subunit-like protein
VAVRYVREEPTELGRDLSDFVRWGQWIELTLDSGDPFVLEPFQEAIVADVLGAEPMQETWVMIPQGNAKTTLMAAVGLYLLDITPSPWIPIGAATRDQAEIMFELACGFIDRSGRAKHRFKYHPGLRRVKSLRNGGVGIKVYAADVKGGDGVIPTDAFVDELHRHDDLKLYRLWKGKLRKRGGRIVTISTAGEPGSPFEDLRETIRNQADERRREGCHLRAVGKGIVYHEWAVPSADRARDLAVVKEANPLSQIDTGYLGDFLKSLTLDFGEDWLRLTCNIPARSSHAAVPESEWDRLETHERIPEGAPVWVGADFGWLFTTTRRSCRCGSETTATGCSATRRS